jgi:hypothetical protein
MKIWVVSSVAPKDVRNCIQNMILDIYVMYVKDGIDWQKYPTYPKNRILIKILTQTNQSGITYFVVVFDSFNESTVGGLTSSFFFILVVIDTTMHFRSTICCSRNRYVIISLVYFLWYSLGVGVVFRSKVGCAF